VTLIERLAGCPSGATRYALRLNGHTDIEINEAVLCGLIRREIRHYASPRKFKVEWFVLKPRSSK
jgi:hypothetical protein